MSPRLRAWLPAAAYMVLIWGLSSIPHPFQFERVPFQDKGAHFVEYGILAALMAHAFKGTWPEMRMWSLFALASSGTVFWGLLDEIHQAYVPGRVADAVDLLADALGSFIGALAYIVFRARRQATQQRSDER